jgi:hypothetical protein
MVSVTSPARRSTMPIERRQILLSDEELAHAVDAYRNASPSFLPPGSILQVNVGTRPGHCATGGGVMTVGVCLTYGETEQRMDVTVRETDIVNLLVRFCPENNVLLPRSAPKTAAAVDGKLALVIEYDHSALFRA